MAWIEQTKKGSRKSGGPQYYLQGLGEAAKAILERRGQVNVALWTPYGPVCEGLVAVSRQVGSVGHDRVQNPARSGSIADRIAYWFGLRSANLERVEVDDFCLGHGNQLFLHLRPRSAKAFGGRQQKLVQDDHPLTIVRGHLSRPLHAQIEHLKRQSRAELTWIRVQICRVIKEHSAGTPHLDERDILRTAGALEKLGMTIGPYFAKGLDCPKAMFAFVGYPPYYCPVELESVSRGFLAHHHAKDRNTRLVVLSAIHDAPEVVTQLHDVMELAEMCRVLEQET
jgi:hypothetical protein